MSEPKIADVFEHWLQGRINLSVGGLMSRLETQERAMEGVLALNITLLDRIKKLEDGERPNDDRLYMEVNNWMKDGAGQDLLDRMVTSAIEESNSTPRGLANSIRKLFEDDISLIDYLDADDITDKIGSVLEGKVKEIVEGFSVSLSVL